MSTPFSTKVPASREEALRALGSPDPELRRLVVRALERAPVDAASSVLSVVLADEDWRVRKEGIQLAHAISERTDVVPVLVDALRAPSDQVALRNAAVEALSTLGPSAASAVEHLLRTGELDADARKLAVDVLAGARQPRSVPVLVRMLDDDDANVRAAAAEALGLIGGDDAIDALLRLLEGSDRYAKLVALEALNRLGAAIPWSQLEIFLADRILRHAAVAALGREASPRALAALVAALDDGSRHVGDTALRSLGDLLKLDPARATEAREHAQKLGEVARKRVLAAAESNDATLRRAALPVLALLADPNAGTETEALVRALRDPDVADDAEAALASLGDAVLSTLIDVARRADAPGRAAVLGVLPRIFGKDPAAIDAVREALRDPDREVVAAAAAAFATALAEGVLPNAADVHALLRIAGGRDAVRGSSAAKAAAIALQSLRTLARVRPEAVRPHLVHVDVGDDEAPIVCTLLAVAGGREHVSWLSRAATAPSPRTRRAAVEALGQIGGADAAVPLAYAITDESEEVALAAIKALGRVRDERDQGVGASALLRLIDADGEEAILAAAVRALGSTGDARADAALRPHVTSNSVAIACAALEALAELEVPDVRALALSALDHPSTIVARTALDVIDGTLDDRDPRAAAELSIALSHGSWEVRRRAIELLTRLDPYAVRPLLVARSGVETEPAVRDALDRAIGEVDRRIARPSRPPPTSVPPEGER